MPHLTGDGNRAGACDNVRPQPTSAGRARARSISWVAARSGTVDVFIRACTRRMRGCCGRLTSTGACKCQGLWHAWSSWLSGTQCVNWETRQQAW